MTDDLTRHARGAYQRALLTGRARWSGSDLRGKARQYGGRYKASRLALVRRLRAAGHDVIEIRALNSNRRWMAALAVDGEIVSAVS